MSGGRITERVERSLGGQPTRSSGGPASGPAGSLPLSWGLGPSNEEKGGLGIVLGERVAKRVEEVQGPVVYLDFWWLAWPLVEQ